VKRRTGEARQAISGKGEAYLFFKKKEEKYTLEEYGSRYSTTPYARGVGLGKLIKIQGKVGLLHNSPITKKGHEASTNKG